MPGERGGSGASANEPSHEPDELLARRVQTGDRQAFETLARRYLRPIHAVAASYLARTEDVEDAAQETFLRALDRIHTFDPARPFAPWLYQVARNVARNRRKALRRRRTEPLAAVHGAAREPDAGGRLEREEIRRLVSEAMETLPEQQRAAFRLFDVEGYSAERIAQLMGVAPGTVRSHVHHARRALRARLAPLLGREDER